MFLSRAPQSLGDSSKYSQGDEGPPSPSPDKTESLECIEPQECYHVFSPRQKWNLIFVIGAAGLFSGLSSNIYFPAEDQIAHVCQSQLQPGHGLANESIGPCYQLEFGIFNHHFLSDRSRDRSRVLGRPRGHYRTSTHLYCLVHSLYHIEHCS